MKSKKGKVVDFLLDMVGERFWVNCAYCHRGFVCRDRRLGEFIGKKGFVVCKYCKEP